MTTAITNQLSNDDRLTLARATATQNHHPSGFVYDLHQVQDAFGAGWDAALEYAGSLTSEGIAHLDEPQPPTVDHCLTCRCGDGMP